MSNRETGSPYGSLLPDLGQAGVNRVDAYLPRSFGGNGLLVGDEEATGRANHDDVVLPFGLGHWKPGFLVALVSRPSVGKTTLALQMALAVARTSRSVVILAKNPAALALHLLAICSRIPLSALRHNAFSAVQRPSVGEGARQLGELPLFLASYSGESVDWIAGLCAAFEVRAVEKGVPELGLLVLDGESTQLARPKDVARILVESESLEQLRLTATKHRFAVLLTATIDRNAENRRDHRPILADLRRTPHLARLGDVIYGLYRDEIYDPDSLDSGLAELLILKTAHGLNASQRLVFEPSIPCFYDLAQVMRILRGETQATSDF